MLISFRNGIVQKPQSPNFLLKGPKGVTLSCNEDPLIVTVSDGDKNYLLSFTENIKNAWKGPFEKNKDYYLYIDIDKVSGKPNFGATHLKPKAGGNLPLDGKQDQHFFEFKSKKMFVKTRSFRQWKHVLRVFVGEFRKGAILTTYKVGSNFNLISENYSGFILFDEDKNPFKDIQTGQFLTSENYIGTDLYNIGVVDSHVTIKKAFEPIPKFYCVANRRNNYICLAKDDKTCIGISLFDRSPDQDVNYIDYGYLYNPNWNWSGNISKPVYVGDVGQISLNPKKYSIQKIGIIIDENTIFVDIEQKISTQFFL